MKVIGFVSSPHENGNTTKLVTKALEGASSAGAETELINVAKLTINGCKGCGGCKTHDGCVQKDDFEKVRQAIISADGIVFGSPIYFFDLNAQARCVEDRLFCFLTPDMKSKVPAGKKCIFITSQGMPDPKTFEANIKKHENIMGMLGIAPAGTLITTGPIEDGSPFLAQAAEFGKKLV